MAHETKPDGTTLERYRHYLYVLAWRRLDSRLRGKADASDAVQETLLKAHKQVAAGYLEQRSDAETKAWPRRILAGTLVDLLRRFGARSRDVAQERSLQAELDEDSARLEKDPAADQSSPSEHPMRLEQAARLREALGQLSAGQWEALDLTKLQGLTLDEAAQRMGQTKDAVAGLIRRGLEKLYKLLGEE